MRYKEAAVAGEFANWAPMFEVVPQFEGPGKLQCTKCTERIEASQVQKHLEDKHKYDLTDGLVVEVDNKWWRRRGVKTQG